VIELCRRQLNFADGLIAEEVGELWEDWMHQVDQVLTDAQLLSTVYEALARRWPNSRTRGRKGTPAEVVQRLLLLKHMRNWSYAILEREVRANLVYRQFTRVGAHKVPDAKTLGKLGLALGPEIIEQFINAWWRSRKTTRSSRGASYAWIPRWWKPTFTIRPIAACSAMGYGCSRARCEPLPSWRQLRGRSCATAPAV